jgi:hypothetical protein
MIDSFSGQISHKTNAASRLFQRICVLLYMHLFCSQEPKRFTTLVATAFLLIFAVPASLQAQQLIASDSVSSSSSLPDAPSTLLEPQSGQTTPPPAPQTSDNADASNPNGPQQTKRILGIMPNFSAVSANTKLPPLGVKEKFHLAARNSFDYSSFLLAGAQAGFAMNGNSIPEFGQGAVGYGRYYWHTLADTASENFMVSGTYPALFRQDPRFYTLGHGGFRKRVFYAATRVLVTRQDSGDAMFNFSEIIGSGSAAGISSLYYPTRYRTWTKVGQKWLTSVLIDSANFTFKEFWPDINHAVFHGHGGDQ